jgi:hypothetical protein
MLLNLFILVLFVGTIYLYINKYCTNTSATQCTSDLTTSILNVAKYLFMLLMKFIYAAIDIVRKNPYPKPKIPKNEDKE